jgi:hypothetical protein
MSGEVVIVIIWKMKNMTGDAAWHIRQFSTQHAATNFATKQRERADVEYVKQVDIL